MKRLMATVAIGVGVSMGFAPMAQAAPDPGIGCETVRWGFLGSQRRTICDGPTRPDGSWSRARVIWTPAHQVPVTCYSNRYYGSCSGGYYVDTTIQAQEEYVVFPDNVLPDEPGWLPAGTNVIR